MQGGDHAEPEPEQASHHTAHHTQHQRLTAFLFFLFSPPCCVLSSRVSFQSEYDVPEAEPFESAPNSQNQSPAGSAPSTPPMQTRQTPKQAGPASAKPSALKSPASASAGSASTQRPLGLAPSKLTSPISLSTPPKSALSSHAQPSPSTSQSPSAELV